MRSYVIRTESYTVGWEVHEGIARLLGKGLLTLSNPSINEGMSYFLSMNYLAWPQAPAIEIDISWCELSCVCMPCPSHGEPKVAPVLL